jgi:hypothetical protein
MNLTYAILSIGDILNIDFSQVEESNENTVRISADGLEFVIKYKTTPTFITDGSVLPLQILNYEDCLALMNTSEWSDQTPPE